MFLDINSQHTQQEGSYQHSENFNQIIFQRITHNATLIITRKQRTIDIYQLMVGYTLFICFPSNRPINKIFSKMNQPLGGARG